MFVDAEDPFGKENQDKIQETAEPVETAFHAAIASTVKGAKLASKNVLKHLNNTRKCI